MKKRFRKMVFAIAIPVTLQSMLQSSFSIVDQLMIGQLGSSSIAAVGLGGNISLIFTVVIGAVATVAGILIAQFLGGEEEKEAWRGLSVSLLFGMGIALLFMAASLFFTRQILGLYTKDGKMLEEGIRYLRLIAFTFVPMAGSSILSVWLRCNEQAMIPLAAGILAVIGNTGLNYLLIFGKCGFPALGVWGAGCATVVSQVINLLCIMGGFLFYLKKEHRRMQWSLCLQKISAAEYLAMIAPILLSEFLWSLGQNVFSAVYGHLGTDSLAAYTLTTPVQGLFVGALSGLSAAAGVIVGKQLGSRSYDQAYRDSRKLMEMGLAGSLLLSLFLVALSGSYVRFYPVDLEIRRTAHVILLVFAAYAPVKMENMILGGGIIRSGGNTRIIMIIDILGTWAVGVPLCLFAAFVLKLSVVPVYAILSLEEVVRLLVTLVMFRKKSWMRSLG